MRRRRRRKGEEKEGPMDGSCLISCIVGFRRCIDLKERSQDLISPRTVVNSSMKAVKQDQTTVQVINCFVTCILTLCHLEIAYSISSTPSPPLPMTLTRRIPIPPSSHSTSRVVSSMWVMSQYKKTPVYAFLSLISSSNSTQHP